uniref:Uncharacterized protein n=1 Tax=Arundo donax TaxID=35708 RepID=A0A0A9GEC6_ARUDO
MTRASAVPVYFSYGNKGESKPTLSYVPNANANKIAWHQGSIWASANCVEAQRHPSTHLTSGGHVEMQNYYQANNVCSNCSLNLSINQHLLPSS